MRNDRKQSRRFNVLYRTSILGLLLVATQIASHPRTTNPKFSTICVPALAINGKIAFTINRDGNREVYVMNADGTN